MTATFRAFVLGAALTGFVAPVAADPGKESPKPHKPRVAKPGVSTPVSTAAPYAAAGKSAATIPSAAKGDSAATAVKPGLPGEQLGLGCSKAD